MSGNSIGRLFTVTTFGESHGPALGCIVDGCPPGSSWPRPTCSATSTAAAPAPPTSSASDARATWCASCPASIEGRTTGTPIGLLIENTDARARDYDKLVDRFRPGHADYTYAHKYGHRDHRGGGRSSARETVMRVAAGAIARKYLAERLQVRISGYLSQIGALRLDPVQPRQRHRIRSSVPTRRACRSSSR